MAMLAWVMMGLAIWHFTIFVDDRFLGGIVGAFVAAIAGSAIFGVLASGLSIPGQDDTTVATTLLAVPGSILGLAVCYALGSASSRREPAHGR
jgi:uncharacterized membrane protein YeaQ/YmgE (transglycosylase-associated protein family)